MRGKKGRGEFCCFRANRKPEHVADQQQEELGRATSEGEALEARNRARWHFSLSHTEHVGCKEHTFQENKPAWLLSDINCSSVDASSRLKMSDLLFALDWTHATIPPTATRQLRSAKEKSAQAENHSLHLVWTSAPGSDAQQSEISIFLKDNAQTARKC